MMIHALVRTVAILLFLLPMQCLRAETVSVPLALEIPLLQQLLKTQFFQGNQGATDILHDPNGCSEIVLSEPNINAVNQHLQIKSRLNAKLAVKVMNRCVPLLSWQGYAQIIGDPVIAADNPRLIYFQVIDSHLISMHDEPLTSGILWDQAREHIHPLFNRFRIDLNPSINDLQATLPLFLPKHSPTQLQAVLNSVRLANMQVSVHGLQGNILFDVASVRLADQAENVLTAQEQWQWEQTWQAMDVLLTQTIKRYAAATELRELRLVLFDILLDARYQLQDALQQGGGNDPLRHWFIQSWTQLIPVIKSISAEHPDQAPLALITLVAASDALQALDKLGPTLGLDISVDGLRRFARLVNHSNQADPLKYEDKLDFDLLRLFEFNDLANEPHSEFNFDFWPVSSAHAVSNRSLDSWLPGRHDLNDYLLDVRELLLETAERSAATASLTAAQQVVFKKLVLTTAWQESCWRQYELRHNKIIPLRSSTSDTGMMQINEKVWRGLVDRNKLRWDVAYNVQTGSNILLKYMTRYAIKRGEHKQYGGIDNLARATYSAYNGGPSQVSRYRKRQTPKVWKRVDTAFYNKYLTVKQGRELAVAECLGGREIKAKSVPVQKKTVKPQNTRRRALVVSGNKRIHSETWLKQQVQTYFTLQLAAFSTSQAANSFIRQQQVPGNYALYQQQNKAQRHDIVLYGRYSTRQRAAKEAARFKGLKPWVRKFKDILQ